MSLPSTVARSSGCRRLRCWRCIVSVAAIGLVASAVLTSAVPESIAPLIPTGMLDTAGDALLASGAPWVGIAPAAERELAVYGAVRTTADGERLMARARQPEPTRSATYAQVAGRLSDPPRPEDLAGLLLDARDLEDLRRCQPGSCGLKLGAAEIAEIRASIAHAGEDWKAAAQQAFRDMLLARARRYLASGDLQTPPYHDRRIPVSPADELAEVLAHLGLDRMYGAGVSESLRSYPQSALPGTESFLTWSKEIVGGGKPIVSLTHVLIIRGSDGARPGTLVAARQVYASHYLTASISMTAIAEEADGMSRYLVYARRSRLDLLTGPFRGLVRRTIEHRIRADGPKFLEGLRQRLERPVAVS
jgi:hypothetical protein